MVVPKIQNAHDPATRNIINRAIEVLNQLGINVQGIVAEGQLTPAQYATLIQTINGLISKGNITAEDIDKNNFKIDQTLLSQELIDAITGSPNANILSEVAEKSIGTEHVIHNSIRENETTFAVPSKNLFTLKGSASGKDLSPTTGELVESSTYVTSDFIRITPNSTIKRSVISRVAQYGKNRNFITLAPNSTEPLVIREDTRFIRIATTILRSETLQVEYGNSTTPYEKPDLTKIPGLEVYKDNLADKLNEELNNGAKSGIKSVKESPNLPRSASKIFPILDDTKNFSDLPEDIKDYENSFKNNSYGYRIKPPTDLKGSIRFNFSNPLKIPKTAAFGFAFYIDDMSSFQNITVKIKFKGKAKLWERIRSRSQLKEGWNIYRSSSVTIKPNTPVDGTYLDDYGTEIEYIEFDVVYLNALSEVTVGKVWSEYNDKAQILFIDDGGYKTFLENGYPQLKERKIPVTWALNPGILGAHGGTDAERISKEDVDNLALDGNSYFSFHSWDSKTNADKTYEEQREDVVKCVRWLRREGLVDEDIFRAAVVQNTASHWQSFVGFVSATRTPRNSRGFDVYPFIDRWNVPTDGLHGMYQLDAAVPYETVTDHFRILKETNALFICYTHGIGTTSAGDIEPTEWADFISQLDIALSEGWIEGVSYEILKNSYAKEIEFKENEITNLEYRG